MESISLLFSTGDERADRIIGGVVGIWESVFPGRIRGYYLFGSYSSGTAASSSDLDLAILFKHGYQSEEEDRAQRLCDCLEALQSAITLDIFYVSEESLLRADRVSVALRLKRSSVLVYGDDTRDRIAAEPDERYIRDSMHIPYYGSRFGRPELDLLVFPLDYPDPDGEFFGYDGWSLNATSEPGTKMLVVIVSRIATALVALRAGQYAGDKQESVAMYRLHIHDEWTDLVGQVYEYCKMHWGYSVPRDDDDRARLRGLCQRALAFENHFYGLYRSYLLKELTDEQPENQLRAIERLGQIIFPETDVIDALTAIAHRNGDDAELRQAAEAALVQIQTALAS